MIPYGKDYTDDGFLVEPPLHAVADPGPAPARVPLRDRMLSVSKLAALIAPTPLVDGLLYRGTLAQLAATAGSYKSFLATGLGCSVATGKDFDHHRVAKREKVIYVAAEGASGLLPRILAWCELNRVEPAALEEWLYVLPCPVQLGNVMDVSEAQELASEIDAGLVILDTRSKCTLGMEENSNTEQAQAVEAAERIVAASGCTVLVIHHNGRSGSAPRGATAWDGGVWSDLRMEGAELTAKVHCEKHKDAISGCDHHFRLVPHTVSEEAMPGVAEAQRQTLVIVPNPDGTSPVAEAKSMTSVRDTIGTSAPPEGLTGAQIAAFVAEDGVSRTRAYAAINALVTKGEVENVGTEKRSRYTLTALGRAAREDA